MLQIIFDVSAHANKYTQLQITANLLASLENFLCVFPRVLTISDDSPLPQISQQGRQKM